MTLFRALRQRSFALLWSGQAISLLGDNIFRVALAWWVLETTGSSVAMSIVLFLSLAPMLALLLVGGALVDRFPRLWMMLVSDLLRGIVITLVATLGFCGKLRIEHMYGFSFVFGLVDAFFHPAYRAALPELVSPENLPSANSLNSLSRQISGMAGPALGAGIVTAGGTPMAFLLDGATFFVSCACLLPLVKSASAPQSAARSEGMLNNVKAGLNTVFRTPWLWITIGVAGLSNIAYGGPMEVALPFLIRDRFAAQVTMLGYFYSASSVGSFLAAVLLGRRTRLRRRGLTLYGAWMLIGILVCAIGLLRSPIWVLGCCAVNRRLQHHPGAGLGKYPAGKRSTPFVGARGERGLSWIIFAAAGGLCHRRLGSAGAGRRYVIRVRRIAAEYAHRPRVAPSTGAKTGLMFFSRFGEALSIMLSPDS